MLDLSTIINDLLSGKAKLHSDTFTLTASAGAAISEDFWECPPNTLRVLISAQVTTTKTSGTAFEVGILDNEDRRVYDFISRTIGSDIISFPNDEGSDKDPSETRSTVLVILEYGDRMNCAHALTVGETISDVFVLRWIEWQMPKEG